MRAANRSDAARYLKGGVDLKKKRIGISAVIIILLIIVASFGTIVRFTTDFLWFQELTYVSVFLKKLFTQVTLGVPFFIVIMLLTYGYLRLVKNDYYKRLDTDDMKAVSEKMINRVSLGIGVIFAFIATMMITATFWFEILKFTHATEYGTSDPVFNIDIGFYLFKLPLINNIVQALMMLIFGFIALTVIYYLFLMSVRRPKLFGSGAQGPDPDNVRRPNFGGNFSNFGSNGPFAGNLNQMDAKTNGKALLALAGRQITILGSCFFLMLAANFFLSQFNLLYSSRGFLYGAGFTDVNVTLWQYRVLTVLALICIFTFAAGLKGKKYKLALGLPVLMIVVSAGGAGLAYAVQNFVVEPDELNKEGKYIEYNIGMTQKAYGLDKIEITDFPANNNLTKQDIANNIETIENIRINDYEPAEQFYNQRQSIRQYYLFNDVDVDRYMVNGRYTQVFLSSREIDEAQLQNQWLTKHIKYTHGYGVTLSKVNSITASGQPDMMIEGIPPVSKVDEIQITRPEIYYGELSNDYVITNTNETEFDYPSGESNVYTEYEGAGGIRLNMLNRVLFAIREQSIQMLVSTNITGDSKILVNRNIMGRVQKIAPFITYDGNPYSVIVDGEHYWMIDAYTTSSYFPYSAPYDPQSSSVNYIRNSIKVVIDAYDGDTKYYVVDESDPLAMTLEKIFPDLFRPGSEMPEGLRAHMRYPEMIFDIQADVYKRYHMADYRVFYQGEDIWDISKETYKQETKEMRPNYYIMKMPGESDVEFTISIPFTPRNKPNMSALMIGRNDGEDYGKLVLFRLPKDKTIYSPMQIDAQVDQDTEISKEFSLWGQQGSSYLRGNMFVVPIEDSFLYVEPIYLQADNENSLPEVKRVIVAYGDRIAYQPTLALALESLFGKGAGDGIEVGEGAAGEMIQTGETPAGSQTTEELAANAVQAYNKAIEAQRNGDWAAYGEYLRQMETYLNQMSGGSSNQASDQAETPSDNPSEDTASTDASEGIV